LDIHCLRESIETVVSRHESLRTRFVIVDGEPTQKIDEVRPLGIEIVDLSHTVPKGSVESTAYERAAAILNEPVPMSIGPLFEAKLLKLAPHEHVLVLAISHLVTDGTSVRILVEEMWGLYWSAIHKQPISLPTPPIQYADYAIWQKRNYESWRARHEAYWHRRLSGAPRLVPPKRDLKGSSTQWITWSFGRELSNRLYDLTRQQKTLLSLTVLTIYVAALSHWCAENDLMLQVISHGRYRHELQRIVGWLATPLLFRIDVDPHDTFLTLLSRVSTEFSASMSHHDHGHMLNLVPEFPTSLMFNWKREPFHVCPTDPRADLTVQPFAIERRFGTFLPFFYDNRTCIDVTVNFDPDVFEPIKIHRFCESLRVLAEGFAQDPDDRLRPLSRDRANLFVAP